MMLVKRSCTGAEQDDAEAECFMGVCYYKGQGVRQSNPLAAHYFESSAKQGFPMAQLMLGCMYCDGLGVGKNLGLGEYWLQTAYDNGEEEAGKLLAKVQQAKAQERARIAMQEQARRQQKAIAEYNAAVQQFERDRARYLAAIQKKKKELQRYAQFLDEQDAWVNDVNRKLKDGMQKLNNVSKHNKTYYNGY